LRYFTAALIFFRSFFDQAKKEQEEPPRLWRG